MKSNRLSIRKQSKLLSVNRSRLYYKRNSVSEKNLLLMDTIDAEFTAHPFTGVNRMVQVVRRKNNMIVNHKRVRRLMRLMALMAIYPRPRTTQSIIEHAKYPCLIRDIDIDHPDDIWCSDITYIRLRHGFMYLIAIMDYFSRYVLSWSVSNSLESLFCLDALDEALEVSKPKVFHSDQGRQYTSDAFIRELKDRRIRISMSGKGRCFDNILVERLWRTVKYEEIYLKEYGNGHELVKSLREYFEYYNNARPHSSLGYMTPAEVYLASTADSFRSARFKAPLHESACIEKTLQLAP